MTVAVAVADEPAEVEKLDPSGLEYTHLRVSRNGVTLPDMPQLVYGDVVALAYLVEETEAEKAYLQELTARVADGAHPLFEAGKMVKGQFEPLAQAREPDKDAAKSRKRDPQAFE